MRKLLYVLGTLLIVGSAGAALAIATSTQTTGPASVSATATQSRQPVGDRLGKTWTQVFDDEFNGTSIDMSRWVALNGWKNNNAISNAKNCSERGGSLILALPGNGTGCDLYSSKKYGAGANARDLLVGEYVEARIWFPGPGSGPTSTLYNWPAFWAYDGSGNWNEGEIDVAEALGHMEANYHGASAGENVATTTGNLANSWHVYGVYRGATQDQVFYDGTLVGTVTTSDDGGPESIMLTSGNTNACCGAPSQTGSAGDVLVDWVRAWK
jgi:beta-glucanase (GH16 family)